VNQLASNASAVSLSDPDYCLASARPRRGYPHDETWTFKIIPAWFEFRMAIITPAKQAVNPVSPCGVSAVMIDQIKNQGRSLYRPRSSVPFIVVPQCRKVRIGAQGSSRSYSMRLKPAMGLIQTHLCDRLSLEARTYDLAAAYPQNRGDCGTLRADSPEIADRLKNCSVWYPRRR